MIERRIKELSIALEVLSRIKRPGTSNYFTSVSDLLKKLLEEAQEQNHRTATDDDDIPF